MGRTTSTFRQWLNTEYKEWTEMKMFLPEAERNALGELLDAALTRSDARSIIPRPSSSFAREASMFISPGNLNTNAASG